MNQTKKLITVVIAMVVFAACQKNDEFGQGERNDNGTGHLYFISNSAKGNTLIDYRRAANGLITFDKSYSTGGNGTGGGLGDQGAVILVDNEIVLAVNAGSNSITSFKVTNQGLILKSTVNSRGERPVSITEYNNVVFVLNAGGDGKSQPHLHA